MRNYFVTTSIFVFLVGVVLVLWSKVGNVGPALLPPKVVNNKDAGLPVEYPLKLSQGYEIKIFARVLGDPRDLEFSPGGTLLVSSPQAGRVVALEVKNDGEAWVVPVLEGLDRPHGIAFHDGKLFVAEESRIVRYNWDEENLKATQDKILFQLPDGGRHFTRSITFDPDGRMFISLGSSCDVCYEKHKWLAAVLVSDADGNNPRLWANGLRNSVFLTINPETKELWGTEMGRDFLGDNLPPDEVNIIREGLSYGWPNCYGKQVEDPKFQTQLRKASPCEATNAPVYEIPAHSAPLGLTFINSDQFAKEWQGDLLVSYHGSWNSSKPVGYKVVRLDVEGERVLGEEDFLTGFLPEGVDNSLGPSQAYGRPVDLTFDKSGSLYISDDKAGVVYKVVKN